MYVDTISDSLLRLRIAAGLGAVAGLVAVVFAFAFSWWAGIAVLYLVPLVPFVLVRIAELAKR